jgi:hypothetical protein
MSSSHTGILPGSRVRAKGGFIGTVEGLEHAGQDGSIQPDAMLVRSDDGQYGIACRCCTALRYARKRCSQ